MDGVGARKPVGWGQKTEGVGVGGGGGARSSGFGDGRGTVTRTHSLSREKHSTFFNAVQAYIAESPPG